MGTMTKEMWRRHVQSANTAIEQIGKDHPEFTLWVRDTAGHEADKLSHRFQTKKHRQWIREKALVTVVANSVPLLPKDNLIIMEPLAQQLTGVYNEHVRHELPMFYEEGRLMPRIPKRYGELKDSSLSERVQGLFGYAVELFQKK